MATYNKTKKFFTTFLILGTLMLLVSCAPIVAQDTTATDETTTDNSWQQITLTNINTQSTFTIEELTNKPTLIETFAVWCPTCTKQQKNIHELLEDETTKGTFNSVSLDVDPNEDEELIIEHIEDNNFQAGRYAISPVELTQALIDAYGTTIVSAPRAPIILLCPNGHSELLQNGLKTTNELIDAINSCT